MITKMIRIKLGLVALCISSTVASAITWDFTGGNGVDAASYDFYDSTNTYKAVATGNENVYWGPQGLGILGGGSTGIDNEGKNDQLYLDLLKPFEIVSFEILGQDGNDMVRWKFEGGYWRSKGIVQNSTPVEVNGTGQNLIFTTGKDTDIEGLQGYKLSKLTVNSVPDSGETFSLLGGTMILLAVGLRRFSR